MNEIERSEYEWRRSTSKAHFYARSLRGGVALTAKDFFSPVAGVRGWSRSKIAGGAGFGCFCCEAEIPAGHYFYSRPPKSTKAVLLCPRCKGWWDEWRNAEAWSSHTDAMARKKGVLPRFGDSWPPSPGDVVTGWRAVRWCEEHPGEVLRCGVYRLRVHEGCLQFGERGKDSWIPSEDSLFKPWTVPPPPDEPEPTPSCCACSEPATVWLMDTGKEYCTEHGMEALVGAVKAEIDAALVPFRGKESPDA